MKTLQERLLDYIEKHPGFDVDNVFERVQDMHKRAIWKLQKRIAERIEHMMTGTIPVFFLTFTFKDEHLPKLEHERSTEDKIRAFMTASGVQSYVANIDYGKKNGRMHWHAVVQTPHLLDHKLWVYGSLDFIKVPKTSISLKLSKYLVKLQRHAVKIQDPLIIYYPRYYKV